MKKNNIFILLFLWVTLPLAAQRLQAESTTVQVGKTGYQQPVTAVFEFQNKSSKKLKIDGVYPDCRCTTVDYPKGLIGGNEKFQIKMTYDARQLGHFDKQAAVASNGSRQPVYICMKGLVLADYHDYSKVYPVAMGDLLLDKDNLEFDDVNRGDQPVQQLTVCNNGTKVCYPNLMHLPAYLSATMVPERLAPGQIGTMTVTLNSTLIHDYGLTQTSVYLAANPGDQVSPSTEIAVSTVLLPSFVSIHTAQLQYAPKMRLSKEQVDIRFDGKKKKSDVILITNDGRTDLNISSLQLFTPGLEVSLGKRVLKPGEKTKLKITALREDLKKVRTRPRILMITNDPSKSKVTITIHAK